ncbi:MAG: hypothetical protein ACHQHP_02640 [Bacteroidia bacterium]
MFFKKIVFLIISLLYFSPLFWQGAGGKVFSQISTTSDTSRMDTLFFLNGEMRAVKVVDTLSHLVLFLPEKKTKKPHVQDVEKSTVFSVKFSNGQEKILYFHDTAVGNVFSVLETKMFMLGEQEADKNYKNKWPLIIGFAVGALSPVALANAVVLSPVPAALSPLHTLIPYIKVNTKAIQNKNYLAYDTYIMGYEKTARKKNFVHAIMGAGAGLITGFAIWAVTK